MGRTRVLVIVHRFLPAVGGVEAVTGALARGLSADHNFDVTVLTRNAADPEYDAQLPYRVVRQPSAFRVFREHMRAQVVIHQSPLLRYSWPQLLRRRPRIGVVHGRFRDPSEVDNPIFTSTGVEHVLRNLLMDVRIGLLRSSTRFVAVSRDVASETGYQARVVPNGYDEHVFFSSTPPRERDNCSLATLGRLDAGKGIDTLIRAFASIQDAPGECVLNVIGDGSEIDSLKSLARQLDVDGRVRFHGRLLPMDAREVLDRCAIGVVPTQVRESFGLAAVEMQSSGCALVASRIGALPEVVGRSAVLVPPGDEKKLAEAVRELIEQPDRRVELAERGLRDSARWTNAAMVSNYADLVREIMGTDSNGDGRSHARGTH